MQLALQHCFTVFALTLLSLSTAVAQEGKGQWQELFNGKTLEGWKANENPDSWKIENGALIAHGPRSHLFYVGDKKPFKNFHLKVDVKTTPGSNGGIYFHTKYQESGWPKVGYECQVNVSQADAKKSGGLYATDDVTADELKANGIKDDEWYTQEIIVQDRHVILKINGQTMTDYTEPENKAAFSDEFERRLGEGTFALQAHDPNSKVYFKNILVKRLP